MKVTVQILTIVVALVETAEIDWASVDRERGLFFISHVMFENSLPKFLLVKEDLL